MSSNINDKVLITSIKGRLPSNSKNKTGDIDFLMYHKDNIIKTVKTDDELYLFKDYLEKFKIELSDNEEYHINHFIDYLKKEYKDETRNIDFSIFNQNNGFALYKLFAKQGNCIFVSSPYITLAFLPNIKEISNTQLKSLERISSLMNQDLNVDCMFISKNKNDENIFGSYDELINYIIDNKKHLGV